MADIETSLVPFLGAQADRRLLNEDLDALPESERLSEPVAAGHGHDRLVAVGSLLTGSTLVGGVVMLLYGGVETVMGTGGTGTIVLAAIGGLLAGTHWGWVHVAEFFGLRIDEGRRLTTEAGEREWLARIQPYPRFSVSTTVTKDAATRAQRFRHEPVLITPHTFTFVRQADAEQRFDADAPAELIASGVETMRRQARRDTDRLRGEWEAASGAYRAASLSVDDDQQRLAAKRAAARALSEHINASLREPPLIE